jgi:hypothetical protein
MMTPMHPQLQAARDLIDLATRDVPYEELAHPVPGRWSAAEVLEHLRLVHSAGAAAATRYVSEGTTHARPPTLTQRMAGALVIGLGVFPKVKAPEPATPSGAPPLTIVADTLAALDALDVAFAQVAQRFGERTPFMNHPYFAGLDVRAWRRFTFVHTRHHVAQVRERLSRRA